MTHTRSSKVAANCRGAPGTRTKCDFGVLSRVDRGAGNDGALRHFGSEARAHSGLHPSESTVPISGPYEVNGVVTMLRLAPKLLIPVVNEVLTTDNWEQHFF